MSAQNYITSAIKTIKTEIEGLNSLLNFFGDNYVKAVDLILNCKGRVVISGMGKSGHIANKIAKCESLKNQINNLKCRCGCN